MKQTIHKSFRKFMNMDGPSSGELSCVTLENSYGFKMNLENLQTTKANIEVGSIISKNCCNQICSIHSFFLSGVIWHKGMENLLIVTILYSKNAHSNFLFDPFQIA
jgi:hypothetical protein